MATTTEIPIGRIELAEYLREGARRYDALIDASFDSNGHADVERYLYGPLRDFMSSGGKRLRPLFCELGCRMVGGRCEDATSAAIAIEDFHSAALIHDDIEDDARMRHGRSCVHVNEGEKIALNVGDYALSLVMSTVLDDLEYDDALKIHVLRELSAMVARTVEGQALDIGWARDRRYDLTVDDYLTMALCKSAHYSAGTPLAVGAIIGGGSALQVEVLREVGLKIGLAFQIRDDLMDLEGADRKTGKDGYLDVTDGKRTLVAVHALNNSPVREKLIAILSSHTTDRGMLAYAVSLMEEAGSLAFARRYLERLCDEATEELERTFPPDPACGMLLAITEMIRG